jgi:hypothetical protein
VKILVALRRGETLPNIASFIKESVERGYELNFAFDSTYPLSQREHDYLNRILSAKAHRIMYVAGFIDKRIKNLMGCLVYCRDKVFEVHYLDRQISRTTEKNWISNIFRLLQWLPFRKSIISVCIVILRKWSSISMARNDTASTELYDLVRSYDMIVVAPGNMPNSVEDELILVARVLKVPSVAIATTLDNLNSKSTVCAIPDRYFVWNSFHKELLLNRHMIPKSKISITGSLFLDRFASQSRSGSSNYEKSTQFLSRSNSKNLDGKSRKVLYLGSSADICSNEAEVFRHFMKVNSQNLIMRKLQVVILPHPSNSTIWEQAEDLKPLLNPMVSLRLIEREEVDLAQLYNCAALVIGINTSALLEAAYLGVPTLALTSKKFSAQMNTSHFLTLIEHGLPAQEISTQVDFSEKNLTMLKEKTEWFVRDFFPNTTNAARAACSQIESLSTYFKARHRINP